MLSFNLHEQSQVTASLLLGIKTLFEIDFYRHSAETVNRPCLHRIAHSTSPALLLNMSASARPSNPSLATGRIRDTDNLAQSSGLTSREEAEIEEAEGAGNTGSGGKKGKFRKEKRTSSSACSPPTLAGQR